MEEIKLFFDSPIKYIKEYHLKTKNEKYEPIIQEIKYDSFDKHFPLLFDFILNFDKYFSQKLKEFLDFKFYSAEFHKYIGSNYKEYSLNKDSSNKEEIQNLHKKFNYLKSEIKTVLEKYDPNTIVSTGPDTTNSLTEEKFIKEMLYEFLNTYEIYHFYVCYISEKLDKFKDIDNLLKDEWDELKSKIINYTNVHTISCMIMSCYDLYNKDKINYSNNFEYYEYDKNILLWAFLLHDIGKYITFDSIDQDFYDYTPNDKVHPFKSGVIAIRMFFRNGFLKVNEKFETGLLEKDVEQLCYFLCHSYRKEKYINESNEERETVKQTFIYLDEIYDIFERIREYHIDNNWIADVLLLIIFHQSLPNVDNPRYSHNPTMEDFNIKRFFKTKRLIELMRFIMINDSAGHTIFGIKVNLCPEINEKLTSLRSLFDY